MGQILAKFGGGFFRKFILVNFCLFNSLIIEYLLLFIELFVNLGYLKGEILNNINQMRLIGNYFAVINIANLIRL